MPNLPLPTPAEVERIARHPDPVLRNLLITQAYHHLSRLLAARTGLTANWCTFATWASKQAGQSIRKEDLLRTLQSALHPASPTRRAAEDLALQARIIGRKRSLAEIRSAVLTALDLPSAVDRTSDAVARGNQKVFAEIGLLFARFLAGFLSDPAPDLDKLAAFTATLRPGDPPDGQRYLSQAFTRYYRAFFTPDPKLRTELILHANLEIGFHEQTRLQPEIAESLNAPFLTATRLAGRILSASPSLSGWLAYSRWFAHRILRRPTTFDRLIQALLPAAQLEMRRILTETMMTIHLPPNLTVRLGDDLKASFPEPLRRLTDPDLCAFLALLDPTPDSPLGSGALDWANLPDRLHFILDLFRCYAASPELFDPPFTPAQLAALQAGRLPEGPL